MDFEEYGWDPETYCHKIYRERKRENKVNHNYNLAIIYKLERKGFEKFDVVIGDEAHLFKSKSLINIMTKPILQNIGMGHWNIRWYTDSQVGSGRIVWTFI